MVTHSERRPGVPQGREMPAGAQGHPSGRPARGGRGGRGRGAARRGNHARTLCPPGTEEGGARGQRRQLPEASEEEARRVSWGRRAPPGARSTEWAAQGTGLQRAEAAGGESGRPGAGAAAGGRGVKGEREASVSTQPKRPRHREVEAAAAEAGPTRRQGRPPGGGIATAGALCGPLRACAASETHVRALPPRPVHAHAHARTHAARLKARAS